MLKARAYQLFCVFAFLSVTTSVFAAANGGLAREKVLLARQSPELFRLYGERFIEPADWEMALKGYRPLWDSYPRKYVPNEFGKPEYAYGIPQFQSFVEGVAIAHRDAESRFPLFDDFRELHRKAYGFPGAFTETYWAIANRIPDIAKRTLALGLLAAGREEEAIRLRLLPQLLGQFRHEPNAPDVGPYGRDGHRYIVSRRELEVLQTRPLLRVAVVDTLSDGNLLVTIDYPPAADVGRLLKSQFAVTSAAVRKLLARGLAVDSSAYITAATEIAGDFYQGVLEIHPFHDGNGRSSKLLRDWLLWHLQLNAPAYTSGSDLAISRAAYAKELKGAVERTRIALKKILPTLSCGGSVVAAD